MPESLEEIATCALYEPTAQREAVLAREIIAQGKRLDALESAGARGGRGTVGLSLAAEIQRERDDARRAQEAWMNTANRRLAERDDAHRERDEALRKLAAFKNLAHGKLDEMGIAPYPDVECRIGARLEQVARLLALAATTPTAGGS